MLLWLIGIAWGQVPYDAPSLIRIVHDTQSLRSYRLGTSVPNLSMSAYQQAASGTVVTGLEGKVGWGIGVFDLGIQELYAAINEEESHTGLSPVNYTKILKGEPCSNQRHVMMHLPIPMLSNRWWVTRQGTNPAMRTKSNGQMAELTWQAIDDDAEFTLDAESLSYTQSAVWVTESQGAWLLIRLDDSYTLGEYHAWSDPGGYIPAGLASSLSATGIEDTFTAMRSFAKENSERCHFNWPSSD